MYVPLTSNSDDISISFLHVRALCPFPPSYHSAIELVELFLDHHYHKSSLVA
jgi:hypothetical protein